MDSDLVKKKILDKIALTEEMIEEYKELVKPQAPDCSIGRVTRMDAINNKSVYEAALKDAQERLINLKNVLSRFGSDDFGKCIKCGSQIPIERILFMPESQYCINCAK